ncbi:hypothetical protein PUNSTDRAFT_135800 [Punctularia strigosozonata HHB-11173 SS5]|uniref:uncharacterized protein n=1 Tax=Punctularia strigosozonata (strain HHB-11173) TaxID=741275 RepID=UPI000441720A|nr:uncharacterized protein PUNSTDRAFT_135800 [Punctularia strigosozonata HHB-11173 SS5]EIN07111.1 hypothetical protein PUNSTDRAFT_135800 [Punctularia strigosozonata HHB-11173 SS5]
MKPGKRRETTSTSTSQASQKFSQMRAILGNGLHESLYQPEGTSKRGESNEGRRPEPDGDGWVYIHSRLKEHDKAMILGFTGDIDTLLVFAGLFSVVLVTFLAPVYEQLKVDNDEISTRILMTISNQLANISESLPAIPTDASPESFKPQSSIVVICSLWFFSLVISLASALLGTFAKQWLREYLLWTTVSPVQHAVHLRQYRYAALLRWRVPNVVTSLQTLMQTAVVLFFGGLITLLWPINHTVAVTTSVGIAITVFAALLAVSLSLFIESCPYKTPLGWLLLLSFRGLLDPCCRGMLTLYYDLQAASRRWKPLARLFLAIEWFYKKLPDSLWDLQVPDAWAHRDLGLTSFGQDPVRSAAWQCRSLLWMASHEEVEAEIASKCVAALPGTPLPRSAGRASSSPAPKSWTSSFADESRIRLGSYWMAISEYLDLGTRKSVPFLDMMQNELVGAFQTHPNIRQAVEQHLNPALGLRLAPLSPTEFGLMFNMLASVIRRCDAARFIIPSENSSNASHDTEGAAYEMLHDHGPFSENNLRLLYTTSLSIMNLLADSQARLRAAYCETLVRILWRSTRSSAEVRQSAAMSEGTELVLAYLHVTIPPDIQNIGQ